MEFTLGIYAGESRLTHSVQEYMRLLCYTLLGCTKPVTNGNHQTRKDHAATGIVIANLSTTYKYATMLNGNNPLLLIFHRMYHMILIRIQSRQRHIRKGNLREHSRRPKPEEMNREQQHLSGVASQGDRPVAELEGMKRERLAKTSGLKPSSKLVSCPLVIDEFDE